MNGVEAEPVMSPPDPDSRNATPGAAFGAANDSRTETRTNSDLELTGAQVDILEALVQNEGSIVGYANLARRADRSKSTANTGAKDLAEKDYVELVETSDSTLIQLTENGAEVLGRYPSGDRTPGPEPDPDGGENQPNGGERLTNVNPPARLHYVTATAELVGAADLPEEWRSRWVRKAGVEWRKFESNDAVAVESGPVRIRVHRESAVLVLKDSVVRDDVTAAFDAGMEELYEAVAWLQRCLPGRVEVQLDSVEIGTTHCALPRHYVASWAAGVEDLDLDDFVIHDEETGDERALVDQSGGTAELEAVQAETAEQDAQFLQEELRDKLHNKGKWRRLRDLPEEVDELEAKLHRVTELMESAVQLQSSRLLEDRRQADGGTSKRQAATNGGVSAGTAQPNTNGTDRFHDEKLAEAKQRNGLEWGWN